MLLVPATGECQAEPVQRHAPQLAKSDTLRAKALTQVGDQCDAKPIADQGYDGVGERGPLNNLRHEARVLGQAGHVGAAHVDHIEPGQVGVPRGRNKGLARSSCATVSAAG